MEKYDWISTIKVNILVFKLVGLWPNGSKGYKPNFYLLHGIIIIFIFGFIQSFCHTWKLLTNMNDLEVVTQTAFMSISECLVVLKIFYVALNVRTFKELMVTLKSDVFQPRTPEQIALIAPSLSVWKLMYNLLSGSITIALILWAMIPVLTNNIKNHSLPFVAWYPFDTEVTPFYVITYVHQMASVCFMSCCNVNINLFVAAFSLYAGAQLDILCDDLKSSSPEGLKEIIILCVKRYREIVKFVKTYNRAFNWIIFIQFFASAVSLGLTMFLLTVVEPFGSEFCSFLFYANTILLEIFIYCWFGNELQVKCHNVFVVTFQAQWVEASRQAKNDLLFFMTRTQRLIKVSALDLFDLSLENFLKILKTSYSYFALVSRLNSDE